MATYSVEVEALTDETRRVVRAMTGFSDFAPHEADAVHDGVVFTFSDDIDDGDARYSMRRNLNAARIRLVRITQAG